MEDGGVEYDTHTCLLSKVRGTARAKYGRQSTYGLQLPLVVDMLLIKLGIGNRNCYPHSDRLILILLIYIYYL